MIVWKCCGCDGPIFLVFHLRSVLLSMNIRPTTHTMEYLNDIDQLSVDIFATDIHVLRQWITPEHVLSVK